jgi:hypothetical protein
VDLKFSASNCLLDEHFVNKVFSLEVSHGVSQSNEDHLFMLVTLCLLHSHQNKRKEEAGRKENGGKMSPMLTRQKHPSQG